MQVRSCYYNGELKYVRNLRDFEECMDLSVYEALQEYIDELIIDERNDERELCESEYDFDEDDLLADVEEAEERALEAEDKLHDLVENLEKIIINFKTEKFLKKKNNKELDYDKLIQDIENELEYVYL